MKKLLYAGIVGPLPFIAVFLIEGATRPGYSAWRHYVSQLATGDGGWMHVLNFLVCGALVLVFALGLRFALRGTRSSSGRPVLLGIIASTTVSTMDQLGTWPNAPTGFLQRIAIITGWTWIAMVAWREVRRA